MLGLVRLNVMAETKKVRVSYVPTGHGLALTIADVEERTVDGVVAGDGGDGEDGVLRVTDACVTLEFPMSDGRTSMLAWDPAEVDWNELVA